MPVKNIIFDFGDVFINLDKSYLPEQLNALTSDLTVKNEVSQLNKKYEVGALTTPQFLNALKMLFPQLSENQLVALWNGMLLDFPKYRLDFLLDLKEKSTYRLFLLSNTNDLHITHIQRDMESSYGVFQSIFEGFYLSHEIGLRKPDQEIFQYVLNRHDLDPGNTLFIDDTEENVHAAVACGIHGWHLKVGEEDIVNLHEKIDVISF